MAVVVCGDDMFTVADTVTAHLGGHADPTRVSGDQLSSTQVRGLLAQPGLFVTQRAVLVDDAQLIPKDVLVLFDSHAHESVAVVLRCGAMSPALRAAAKRFGWTVDKHSVPSTPRALTQRLIHRCDAHYLPARPMAERIVANCGADVVATESVAAAITLAHQGGVVISGELVDELSTIAVDTSTFAASPTAAALDVLTARRDPNAVLAMHVNRHPTLTTVQWLAQSRTGAVPVATAAVNALLAR